MRCVNSLLDGLMMLVRKRKEVRYASEIDLRRIKKQVVCEGI